MATHNSVSVGEQMTARSYKRLNVPTRCGGHDSQCPSSTHMLPAVSGRAVIKETLWKAVTRKVVNQPQNGLMNQLSRVIRKCL